MLPEMGHHVLTCTTRPWELPVPVGPEKPYGCFDASVKPHEVHPNKLYGLMVRFCEINPTIGYLYAASSSLLPAKPLNGSANRFAAVRFNVTGRYVRIISFAVPCRT